VCSLVAFYSQSMANAHYSSKSAILLYKRELNLDSEMKEIVSHVFVYANGSFLTAHSAPGRLLVV
jgi:hypothetical protein